MRVHRGSRRQRGVGIIEVLVTLAFLSIVLGLIVLPNLRRSIKRAEMISQVKMIQQAVGVSRIHSIKNSARVALQLLPQQQPIQDQEIFSWVDSNANGSFDPGEEEVGRWPLENRTFVSYDPSDSNRSLHSLAGSALGVVFLPNGTSIAHDNQIGTGQGSMVLEDTDGNRLRVTITGGAGSTRVEMWDPDTSQYSNQLRFWRY